MSIRSHAAVGRDAHRGVRNTGREGTLDDERTAAMQADVEAEVEDVFVQAARYPDAAPDEVYAHTFAEDSPAIARQREWRIGG